MNFKRTFKLAIISWFVLLGLLGIQFVVSAFFGPTPMEFPVDRCLGAAGGPLPRIGDLPLSLIFFLLFLVLFGLILPAIKRDWGIDNLINPKKNKTSLFSLIILTTMPFFIVLGAIFSIFLGLVSGLIIFVLALACFIFFVTALEFVCWVTKKIAQAIVKK